MSTQPEQPKKRKSGVTGAAIPAGLLIGIGVGFLVDEIVAGTMIGLGCGFLLMIILRAILGEW
jgi:hypothetical protein